MAIYCWLHMNILYGCCAWPPLAGHWALDKDLEQLSLRFPSVLSPPRARIALHFNYTLSRGLSGFYLSNLTSVSLFHLKVMPRLKLICSVALFACAAWCQVNLVTGLLHNLFVLCP